MAKVFISYRRADSATFAGRIYDRLIARFGKKNVFKDVDDIPPGVDFADYIQVSLRECAVALALIGREWLTARTDTGARRLDDPADFVRIEIETAFALGLTVIPVLVDGASMPASAEELPEALRRLARINAVVVRNDPDFNRDMERLLAALERAMPAPAGATPVHPSTPAPVLAPAMPSVSGPGAMNPTPAYPAARPYPAPAIPAGAGQAILVLRQSATFGTLMGWGLAFGVPLAAGGALMQYVQFNTPAVYGWTFTPPAEFVGALLGFFLTGFFAARHLGKISSSLITASVAALVSGIFTGSAYAWASTMSYIAALQQPGNVGNGPTPSGVFRSTALLSIPVFSIFALILSIPASAFGGAIGKRTKPPRVKGSAKSRADLY